MTNLSNEIKSNLESEKYTLEEIIHESTNDANLNDTDNLNQIKNSILISEEIVHESSYESKDIIHDEKNDINNDDINNTSDNVDDKDLNNNSEVSNCLALTVKKDYSIAVVKNVFVRTVKGIWKVAVSIFTLNLIKFFF